MRKRPGPTAARAARKRPKTVLMEAHDSRWFVRGTGPCYTRCRLLTAALPRPPALDPSFSPLLRFVPEHSARACHQILGIRCDAGVFMSTKLYVGNLPY